MYFLRGKIRHFLMSVIFELHNLFLEKGTESSMEELKSEDKSW